MLFFLLSFDSLRLAQEVTAQLKVFDYSVLEILETPASNNNGGKNSTHFQLNTRFGDCLVFLWLCFKRSLPVDECVNELFQDHRMIGFLIGAEYLWGDKRLRIVLGGVLVSDVL